MFSESDMEDRQAGKKVRRQLAAGICRRISKGLTLIEGKGAGEQPTTAGGLQP